MRMRMFFAGLVAALTLAFVQEGRAVTIFSGIGLGDEERVPDGRGSGMGGAGIAILDGQNFSRLNPAVLGAFKHAGLSLLFATQERSVKDGLVENRLSEGDVGHVRMVFPYRKRMVFRIGIEPVTGVNFAFRRLNSTAVEADTLKLHTRGGLEALSFGVGAPLMEGRLFIGGGMDAIVIGTIEESWTRSFVSTDSLYASYSSQDEISRRHRGVQFTVGAAYRSKAGFSLGAFLTPRAGLTQTRVLVTPFGVADRFSVRVHLPTTFGVGLGYHGPGGKWVAALDLTASRWQSVDASLYRNAYALGGGISYVRGKEDPLGRARRYPLRVGFSRKALQYAGLGKDAVKETAGSVGVGLPFRGGWGRFDISFEAGKRGNVQANGAEELFFRQTFSIVGWPR